MNPNDFAVEITRVKNGYVCRYPDPQGDGDDSVSSEVIADDDNDELKAGEELLWWIIDYFGIGGSRHDAERLTVTRRPGDKHPSSDKEGEGQDVS